MTSLLALAWSTTAMAAQGPARVFDPSCLTPAVEAGEEAESSIRALQEKFAYGSKRIRATSGDSATLVALRVRLSADDPRETWLMVDEEGEISTLYLKGARSGGKNYFLSGGDYYSVARKSDRLAIEAVPSRREGHAQSEIHRQIGKEIYTRHVRWDSRDLDYVRNQLMDAAPACIKKVPPAELRSPAEPRDREAVRTDASVADDVATKGACEGACKIDGTAFERAFSESGYHVCKKIDVDISRRLLRQGVGFCDGDQDIVNPFAIYEALGTGELSPTCGAYLLEWAKRKKSLYLPHAANDDAKALVEMGALLTEQVSPDCYSKITSPEAYTSVSAWNQIASRFDGRNPAEIYCAALGLAPGRRAPERHEAVEAATLTSRGVGGDRTVDSDSGARDDGGTAPEVDRASTEGVVPANSDGTPGAPPVRPRVPSSYTFTEVRSADGTNPVVYITATTCQPDETEVSLRKLLRIYEACADAKKAPSSVGLYCDPSWQGPRIRVGDRHKISLDNAATGDFKNTRESEAYRYVCGDWKWTPPASVPGAQSSHPGASQPTRAVPRFNPLE